MNPRRALELIHKQINEGIVKGARNIQIYR